MSAELKVDARPLCLLQVVGLMVEKEPHPYPL